MLSGKSAVFIFTLTFLSFLTAPFSALSSEKPVLVKISDTTFEQKRKGKQWQIKRSKRLKTEEEVAAYLTRINQGEYNDWRLPTKQELFELFSNFDLKENGDLIIRLEGSYWLSEPYGTPYVGSWEIGDQCGPSRTFYKGKKGYVRAIRP